MILQGYFGLNWENGSRKPVVHRSGFRRTRRIRIIPLAASPTERGVAATLAGLVAACSTTRREVGADGDLFRVDDEATILAAAKAIIGEDPVAALITIDANGVPRARSVGVSTPDGDLTFWIGTRRSSRKLEQIRNNPLATLYFNRDNNDQGNEGAYYASFMGQATVHTDLPTLELQAPAEEYRREFWPNFPDDFAAIRFETHWLEVTGHGIRGSDASWQPQAVIVQR
jgi:general stress protein 26